MGTGALGLSLLWQDDLCWPGPGDVGWPWAALRALGEDNPSALEQGLPGSLCLQRVGQGLVVGVTLPCPGLL